MEMGWQHQRRRKPITGKKGQLWDKTKLKRCKGHEGREGISQGNCCTIFTDGREVLPPI